MIKQVFCVNECGFTDEFEPDELGVNYYQSVAMCPACKAPTVYADGSETFLYVTFEPAAKRVSASSIFGPRSVL